VHQATQRKAPGHASAMYSEATLWEQYAAMERAGAPPPLVLSGHATSLAP
jgi:hypothetical protein